MLVREKGEVEWEDSKFFTISKYKNEEFIAEKYAEYCYDPDLCTPDDFEMVVEVLSDNGEIKVFDVSARVDIDFNAEEREKKKDK